MSGSDRELRALGKNVRERRTALGLSQQQLARKAGLDRSYLSEVERGLRNVSLLRIAHLANALGTSIADLLKGIEP